MAHRPRWTLSQVTELFEKPLLDLLFEAQQVHRQHFDPRQVQVSTLLSIKTGACPEDCKYCPQSSRYKTGLEAERLMEVEQVLESARKAKAAVKKERTKKEDDEALNANIAGKYAKDEE